MLLSGISFLVYSKYIRKTQHSRYWKIRNTGNLKMTKLQDDITRKEQIINAYKECIQFTIRVRNLFHRLINIVDVMESNPDADNESYVKDQEILAKLNKEIIAITGEIDKYRSILAGLDHVHTTKILKRIQHENLLVSDTLYGLLRMKTTDPTTIERIKTSSEKLEEEYNVLVVNYKNTLSAI